MDQSDLNRLEEKINRLNRNLERSNNWMWILVHNFYGAIISTLGVIFVLTVGAYILHRLEVIPGFSLFLDQFLPALERWRGIRGL